MLAVFPPDDSTSGSGLFRVDPSNGVLSTIDTFERDGVNGKSYYNIVVLATDGGTSARSVSRTVRVALVDVNDNRPAFSQSIYDVSLDEDQGIGTSVLQLAASDGDVTSTLTYSISSGNSANRFRFSSSSAGLLETSAVIDLDTPTPDLYTLVVNVVDGGSPQLTGTATVFVRINPLNDNSPVFGSTAPATITVSSNNCSLFGNLNLLITLINFSWSLTSSKFHVRNL